MTRWLSMCFAAFSLAACALTFPDDPLIKLSEDSTGNAIKTRRIALRNDGVVIEERINFFAGKGEEWYNIAKVGKSLSSDLPKVVDYGEVLVKDLPQEIDEMAALQVDPETRVIRVKIREMSYHSGWASFSDGAHSEESRAFDTAWNVLLSILLGKKPPEKEDSPKVRSESDA